jgi:hypothetical protein
VCGATIRMMFVLTIITKALKNLAETAYRPSTAGLEVGRDRSEVVSEALYCRDKFNRLGSTYQLSSKLEIPTMV